ncbi:MAG: beta-lactamase family protein [Acidimicrobiia bacterium]|nr:beta-lactamase family protein [Acidimicrobiia bacterium]
MTYGVPFAGRVDPAFGAVGEAFRSNFTRGADGARDLGAALCLIVGGRVVVDCWAGWRDIHSRRPWESDTLVNAYSVLKPVTAVLALSAVEQGLLDLDGRVSRDWPELAGEGTEGLTLRQVLSHRAGLPAVRPILTDDALYDWDAMCAALAVTDTWWEPGAAHGYHVNTFGFLAGEPVRRAHGSRFADALRDVVTGPLDLDLHIGVGGADLGRVADIDAPAPETLVRRSGDGHGDGHGAGDDAGGARRGDGGQGDGGDGDEHRRMLLHTYFNPPGLSGFGTVNSLEWRRAAIPSTNGHATARAVAAFYAALLPGASPAAVSPATLAEAITPHSVGHDIVLERPSRFGLGLALHMDERPVGATTSAYGHYGYGGSLGFADPDAGVAFAYLINRPGERWQNPRTRGLLDALRSCL